MTYSSSSLSYHADCMPVELREISYIFSGFDRVLAFRGMIKEDLDLDNIMVGCTHIASGSSSATAELLEQGLFEGGWSLGDWDGRAIWSLGEFRIRVDECILNGLNLSSLLLWMGEGHKHIRAYIEHDLPRHVCALLNRPPSANRNSLYSCRSVDELSTFLAGKRLLVFSGAGVSVESGIPAFDGPGSLGERLGFHEPFPGEVPAWMLGCPSRLVTEIHNFQVKLATVNPGIEHRILSSLERSGIVTGVVTTNIDMLHEIAGSRLVMSPAQLSEAPSDIADVLLVLGVSEDTHGIIARARSAGLSVVSVGPKPPIHLADGDIYVQSYALDFLRALLTQSSKEAFSTYVGPASVRVDRNPIRMTIPDLPALLEFVESHSTSRKSVIHGDAHWRDTAFFGAQIVHNEGSCDPGLVFLFALLHDSLRVHDGNDPDHGPRSALLVDQLRVDLLKLSDDRAAVLKAACAYHSCGSVTADPTIGACWDADRLGLWRIGIVPAPGGFSLATNRSIHRIESARLQIGTKLDWGALFKLFEE